MILLIDANYELNKKITYIKNIHNRVENKVLKTIYKFLIVSKFNLKISRFNTCHQNCSLIIFICSSILI